MNTKPNKNILRFRRLGVSSIIAVYLLIFVGGIVRSSGSGMGCPDWPKCFGQWVPPTSVIELPQDYKEVYSGKRKMKNMKLASILSSLGADRSATKILGDEGTYVEENFNATKTWVEYINRLIGAIIGILLFALFLSALPMFKMERSLAAFSGLIVILTGFQGWLGSIVVSTNLLPGMITIHMLLALLIIAFLIILVFNSFDTIKLDSKNRAFSKLSPVFVIMLLALIPQIILGTDVREGIDSIAKVVGMENRNIWIENLGQSFYIHRSLSWLFMGLSAFAFYRIFKLSKKSSLEFKAVISLLVLVSLEIAFGAGMYFFDVPAVLQPLHLLFGTLLFGVVLLLLLMSLRSSKIQVTHE